ncbi:hypothetical protein QB714_002116 [Salmonella enterica]|nr:hypothetical protein [Salmonella enterica subsp. enterica serovar Cubana]EKS4625403.1 hypothetical protein [Salmonella enterica]EDQ3977673.1 hypothetical protein [Salmonella enterica subsp. enterica serovar Cubana]EKS4718500.1 hypothetical protein [Salmonella enterica]EKS4722035.1 hypothetical protein [Salmonella enterica]
MTIVEAIKMALDGLARPATYIEIYQEIIDKGLYDFGAKDPKSIVRVKLRIHTAGLNFPSSSPKKYFQIISGEGKDALYFNLDEELTEAEVMAMDENNENTSGFSMSGLKKTFFSFVEKIKNIDRNAHKSTLHECFWMLLGSFLPILVDSLFRRALLNISFLDAIYANIKSGEVFLFTSALITPFFFFLIKTISNKNNERNELPYFGFIFTITLGALISGLLAFVFYRTGVILLDSKFSSLNNVFSGGLGIWAWVIYCISLFIWYYSAYMNHKTSAGYRNIRDSQFNDLAQEFNGIKG